MFYIIYRVIVYLYMYMANMHITCNNMSIRYLIHIIISFY